MLFAFDGNAVLASIAKADALINIIKSDAFGGFCLVLLHMAEQPLLFFWIHTAAIVKDFDVQHLSGLLNMYDDLPVLFHLFQSVKDGVFYHRLQKQRKDVMSG